MRGSSGTARASLGELARRVKYSARDRRSLRARVSLLEQQLALLSEEVVELRRLSPRVAAVADALKQELRAAPDATSRDDRSP